MKRFFAAAFFCLLPVLVVWSHLNSISYALIDIGEKEVKIELRLTLICMLELFTVDTDGDLKLSEKELEPVKPVVFYYLNNKIKILSGGQQLRMEMKSMRFSVEEDDSYVTIDLRFPREKTTGEVVVLNNVLEETDPFHRNIAEVKTKDKEAIFVFTNSNYLDTRTMPAGVNIDSPTAIESAAKTR